MNVRCADSLWLTDPSCPVAVLLEPLQGSAYVVELAYVASENAKYMVGAPSVYLFLQTSIILFFLPFFELWELWKSSCVPDEL